jgi:hypothetical protein
MFDYQESSVEQIAEHVKKSSRQAITGAKKYYASKGREDVVQKIDKARLLARRDAALAKAEKLAAEAGV